MTIEASPPSNTIEPGLRERQAAGRSTRSAEVREEPDYAPMLWRALGPHRKALVTLLVITGCSSVAETLGLGMILPLLRVVVEPISESGSKGSIIDYFLAPFPPQRHLVVVCLATALVFLVKNLLAILLEWYATRFVARLQLHWSARMLDAFLRVDFHRVARQKHGSLLNDIVTEPKSAAGGIRQLVDYWAKIAFGVSMTTVLFVASWRATLLLGVVSLGIIFALWRLTRRYSVLVGEKKVRLNQKLSGAVGEAITGIRQVHAYGLAGRVEDDFKRRMRSLVALRVAFRVRAALPKSLLELVIVALILATILYYRYLQPVSPAAVVPVLGLFVVSAEKLYQNLASMLTLRMQMHSQLAALRVVQETLDAATEPDAGGAPAPELSREVRFDEVSFGYEPARSVLNQLSMSLRKGRVTGLVGASGAGKSTVCDLIVGLLRPSSGRIAVDDVDLADVRLEDWRARLGFVSQDTFLFNTTLEENIRVGKADATPDQIRHAARAAGVEEFVESLPLGFATVLGDRGVNLSGGQRQRVALARALVRDPALLILDEATSGLDAETEARILRALKMELQGRTMVVLTHRLTALAIADDIMVLEDGAVVESGSYAELLERRGAFWRLSQAHTELERVAGD